MMAAGCASFDAAAIHCCGDAAKNQQPKARSHRTLFQWKSPRMRTEASAVVDSTIADTSTSPSMTRTMVLMFMAPSLYAQACSASQNACPPPGDIRQRFK